MTQEENADGRGRPAGLRSIWNCADRWTCRRGRADGYAQKAAFYAHSRRAIVAQAARFATRRLQAFNDLIDEVETRLKETEKYDRRKKKKLRILPPPPTNAQIDYRERQEAHFAQGMTFYKLFWVFFIGCFAGVVLETIYCLIQRGHYESRV
ncbi:MAG: hypothetical protein ACLUI3_09665, partial [Christensenellales bacterium]